MSKDLLTLAYEEIARLAANEADRGYKLHGEMHSFHEAYGVLLEEVDELWDEIKAKNQDEQSIRTEAIQVAAMAIRTAVLATDTKHDNSTLNVAPEPPAETVEAKMERLFDAGYSVEVGREVIGVPYYYISFSRIALNKPPSHREGTRITGFHSLSEALDDALEMAGLA